MFCYLAGRGRAESERAAGHFDGGRRVAEGDAGYHSQLLQEDGIPPPPAITDSQAREMLDGLQQWLMSKDNGYSLFPQLRSISRFHTECAARGKKQSALTDFFKTAERR